MTPLLCAWAARWAVHPQAMEELRQAMLGLSPEVPALTGRSESAVQSMVRLEAARKGVILWRNNVGAVQDHETGSFVRYGLCNDSARVNEQLKSADLIGIRRVLVTPGHVGQHIGQFVSREVKHGGWQWTGSPREVAQANFAALVNSYGGDACFAANEGTV